VEWLLTGRPRSKAILVSATAVTVICAFPKLGREVSSLPGESGGVRWALIGL
jgi:hypothetical protein